MKFEEYFSFEAILGDLVRWRIRGRDVGGTLPARKAGSRAGIRGRGGVAPSVVRQRAIWRKVCRLRQDRKRERDACDGNGDDKQIKKQGRESLICDWITAALS